MYSSKTDQIVGISGYCANIQRLPNFTGATVPASRMLYVDNNACCAKASMPCKTLCKST